MARFDAKESLELIDLHGVTLVLFVPTMMQRIWRLPDEVRNQYKLDSLETVMCTGAPSPQWLKRAWIGWLGPERIHEAYGGSERVGGTQIGGTEWLEHPGSVGLLLSRDGYRRTDPRRYATAVCPIAHVE